MGDANVGRSSLDFDYFSQPQKKKTARAERRGPFVHLRRYCETVTVPFMPPS